MGVCDQPKKNQPKIQPNIQPNIQHSLSENDIARCPECNLICSLKLNYKEGKPIIDYECENQHKGNILLEEYLNNFNKFSLSKEKCNDCEKNQEEKEDFFYCSKCEKFICRDCQKNHPSGDQHNIINIKKYDSLCKNHSNTYDSYCIKCKTNLCIYCKSEHKSHNLKNLSEFNYSEESKNKLEKEINNMETKINKLDIIKENIINEINKLKESSELEMNFIKRLLDTYEYEKIQSNINYNIIQNLKNFETKLKSNKIELVEKEGNKYIYLLRYIKSNSFKNNFTTLTNHTNSVNHLSKLNDGRLISCGADGLLNIYKKDSYDLQLSIKEHLDWIHSFTQLNDGRIITCSRDNTMKIIKLIEEDKYKIEQTLQGHRSFVYKVIEIKKNELISVSSDKTMRIWKLNNQNKFECNKEVPFQNKDSQCNILILNKNEFVTSSCEDKCIKFWNSNNYSNIATINNIETPWTLKAMCLLEDDILCVGGQKKGFYLIKISTHKLIKNILGTKTIYAINECLDGLFLCSIEDENGNSCLVKYQYEKENKNLKKIFEKEKAHNNYIYSCVQLNDGTIASGGYGEGSIKLWKD